MSDMTTRRMKAEWRYLHPPTSPAPSPRPTVADVTQAEAADRDIPRDHAWQRLLALHLPFHLAPDPVYARLIAGLSDIEMLFLDSPDDTLAEYYEECTRELDDIAHAPPPILQRDVRELPAIVRHVAALQVQFMEEVFKGFRLDRYANALDSRGWMNTFRRWGCSPTFTAQFDSMEEVLSESFVVFFYHHVRDCAARIEARPVPHPWDSPLRRATSAVPRTMRGVRGLTPDETREAGIFLDSGIGEAQSRRGSTTRTATQATGAPPSKEGEPPHGGGLPDAGPSGGAPPPSGDSSPPATPND